MKGRLLRLPKRSQRRKKMPTKTKKKNEVDKDHKSGLAKRRFVSSCYVVAILCGGRVTVE